MTSTKKDRIPAFLADLRASEERLLALFPTCLSLAERRALYAELESLPGLRIPHAHLRSDCGLDELAYLSERFGTEAFNIHPRASSHPYGPLPAAFASRIYIENVDDPAEDAELEGDPRPGGLCPDFSHLESARLAGLAAYEATVLSQLARYPVGCCHVSAIRVGVPNHWAGTWDHHEYAALGDLDYLARYAAYLPERWVSLELENPLAEQLAAKAHIEALLA